jgi:glycosyltransferase 2 family protein
VEISPVFGLNRLYFFNYDTQIVKKVLISVFKLAATCLFLFLIWQELELKKVIPILRLIDTEYALLGWLLTALGYIIASCRWQLILRSISVAIRFGEALRLTYIGAFFSTFLPGDSGGDIAKVYYICKKYSGKKWESGITVFIDRFVGLCTLFIFAALCLPFAHMPFQDQQLLTLISTALWAIAGGSTTILLLLLFGYPLIIGLRRNLPKPVNFLPIIEILFKTYKAVGGKPGDYLPIIVVSFLSQICLYFGAYLIGLSLSPSLMLLPWLILYPVIIAATALPITYSGLGLREYLFILFSEIVSFDSHETALATSLLILVCMMTQNAVGGLVYLFSKSMIQINDVKRSVSV